MARKLAVSPSEIIQFLATENISVDDNANTRLDDIHLELLRKKFGPVIVLSRQEIALPVPVEVIPDTSVEEPVALTVAGTFCRWNLIRPKT